ncbi:flagellin [uncultured Shewanella sp.]|uniref:flagellin N-terminal helical domain-containing protein n=1 Tax=uncultured Shewanella sp. TaxID=173975 RepID=UPI00263A255B|nr:flagellin [uncultured Shewanella sp.]
MLSVHTNHASLIGQNAVNKSNDLLTNAMERLSTGLRINSSADDAAGLQIASRLNANIIGMQTASRNVSDATSMLQTADGALSEITTIANRQKELAIQAANGVNSAEDLKSLDKEFQQLTTETERIMTETTFAGNALFDVLDSGVNFQIGASNSETLSAQVDFIDVEKFGMTDAQGNGGRVELTSISLTDTSEAIDFYAGKDGSGAAGAMEAIDGLLNLIGETRSSLGANINRLGHTASNLANVTQHTQEASSRIMDADFAVESANMTKNQLLVQAGTNILSSTNQNTGLVLGLLS